MNFERVRVGDVLALERIPVSPVPEREYVAIGIRSFGKGIFHYEPKLGNALGSLRFFEVHPGRLIISNIKGWEGAIALSSHPDAGCIASNRFLSYLAKDDRVDISWATWFFLSDVGIELIQRASPGSADRNRTLAIDRFEGLQIPLPPIAEQRRVAQRLDSVRDSAIRAAQLSDRAHDMSEALLLSLASANHSPRQLGDVLRQVRREEMLEPTRTYRLVGCRWYGEGLFVREERTGSEISAKRLFKLEQGDLVYNRLFAWKGSFAVADEEVAGCYVSSEFPVFEVDSSQVDRRYLVTLLRTPGVMAQVDQRSAGGTPTSRNRLKEEQFLQMQVPLPPVAQQVRIADSMSLVLRAARHRSVVSALIAALPLAAVNEAFADLDAETHRRSPTTT